MKAFLRWTVVVVVGLGVLAALFYAEEDLRGWHAWNKYKHAWEAKGEKFDSASITPPPVPDDQNFAMSPVWIAEVKYIWQDTPERARAWYGDRIDGEDVARLFPWLPVSISGLAGTKGTDYTPKMPDASGNWMTARATDLKPWQSYYRNLQTTKPAAAIPITPQPQSPAADVLLALSKYDPVIERLRQDSALPDSRFPVIYTTDDPAAILLPHLAIVKRHALVLQLRAIAELQNGESDKALDDVKLMLRLTDSVRTEPFLISHLVRIAILNLTLQPVWEGLANRQWSDAQLTALDSELAKLDFLADYKLSMRGEMGFQDGILKYLRQHPGQLQNYMSNGSGGSNKSTRQTILELAMISHLVPSGWYYQNQLHCDRAMESYFLTTVDEQKQTVSPALVRQAIAAVAKERKHPTPFNILESLMLPGLDNAVTRFASGQSSVNLARTAIALERYRLVYGEYPGAIDALAPRFIEELPHDIINGQPLKYQHTEYGKFMLYSVGWNETDDGGKSGGSNSASGDWVWRYP